MKYTLKEQIEAIQASMIGCSADSPRYEALNDAASTIASLNLVMALDEHAQLDFFKNIKDLAK